jgi:hypothetical protein
VTRTPQGHLSAADEGEARAWGWVNHLRSGGTTPWSAWHEPAPHAERAGRYLPGAQQLELLRRLNERRVPQPELVERVLTASAPGRGRPDLALNGVLDDVRFGPPPVDPSELRPDELLGVATSLIAEDVVAAGPTSPSRPPRRLRRRFRVLGDPDVARQLRESLIADGRPPGGPRPTVVVVADDVETLLVHAFTARCFGSSVRPWREWLAGVTRGTSLPPRLDPANVARTWSRNVGPTRVHVVLGDPVLAARLAGLRRRPPAVNELSAHAVELARRTAFAVGTLVPPDQRGGLMWQRLRPALARYGGPALRVPERYDAWLSERTEDLRRRLAAGDYAVHGQLSDSGDRPGVTAPDDVRVLTLAMQVLLGPSVGAAADHREGA